MLWKCKCCATFETQRNLFKIFWKNQDLLKKGVIKNISQTYHMQLPILACMLLSAKATYFSSIFCEIWQVLKVPGNWQTDRVLPYQKFRM